MVRKDTPLSELARAGFSSLSESRAVLDALDLPPDLFSHTAFPDQAATWVQRVSAQHPVEAMTLRHDEARFRDLLALAGASEGLAEFLRRQPGTWAAVTSRIDGPRSQQDLFDAWSIELAQLAGEQAITALRVLYRTELARLALFDVCSPAPIDIVDRVAEGLADLAGAVLDGALLLARRELGFADDEVPLAIIGMGKAGARELNYVSDVDVIYVTDIPEGGSPEVVLRQATQLAIATQRAIMDVGMEPGLWEVDANLRPEGKDGALVRTLDSHIAYYQRWAHDWEFQAQIKARPLAGSVALGNRYRQALHPMVWEASARPGFVEQVQRMRERVTHHIPADQVDIQLKLGPGGLRDIEFTIQLLQLVHGRHDDRVRQPDTLSALRALAECGYVGRGEAQEFERAYRFLRTLEHRLQLSRLTRTHLMPRDEEALRVLARSTQLADTGEALHAQWRDVQRQVRSLHERLFYRPLLSAVAGLGGDGGLELTSEQAADRLRASGFMDPSGALRHIAALTQGVSRSAQIHRTLLPVILRWLADGTRPDEGLLAFRRLSDDLGDTTWFLRMLRDSSGAAIRLTRVLATSGYVAALFERVPDGVSWLDDGGDLVPRSRESLVEEMTALASRYPDEREAGAKALRQVRRRELLRLAMASVLGELNASGLGQALKDLHAAYIEGALVLVDVPLGIDFAAIAMGRFGGGELSFASDSDVLWVYRDTGAGEEAHSRALALVKDLVAVTEDVLFPCELDAGLRPEGKNGPLARSLDAYQQYYDRWALGWEAQALLRASDVAGSPSLRQDFMELANRVRYPNDFSPDSLREIRRIKARVEAERLPQGADPARHLKLGRGSLSDVEWLVQLVQLARAHDTPSLRTTSTLASLDAMVQEGLLPREDADILRDAWVLASSLRNALTLFGQSSDVVPMDRRLLEGAARLLGYSPRSASALEEHYLRTTRIARQVYEKHFLSADFLSSPRP